MPSNQNSTRPARSVAGRTISDALLWGVLVGALVNIVEYNLTGIFTDSYSVGWGQLIGGAIAGYLSVGSRRDSLTAGALAGAIPIAVLAPLSLLFTMAAFSDTMALEWIVTGSYFLLVVGYPLAIAFGAVVGTIGAFVGHWISTFQ